MRYDSKSYMKQPNAHPRPPSACHAVNLNTIHIAYSWMSSPIAIFTREQSPQHFKCCTHGTIHWDHIRKEYTRWYVITALELPQSSLLIIFFLHKEDRWEIGYMTTTVCMSRLESRPGFVSRSGFVDLCTVISISANGWSFSWLSEKWSDGCSKVFQ